MNRDLSLARNDAKSIRNYIGNELDMFLESKSNNTAKNYRVDINQFCSYIFGKEPKFVTIEEIANITSSQLVGYKNSLKEKSKSTTVNRKIKSIRSFFKFLEADHPEIRTALFNKVTKIKELDKKGWGELTLDEVNEIVERAKSFKDGEELSVLFEVAFITAIRLDALLTATYNNNIFHREEDGEMIWTMEVIDKSEIHIKSISDELKERIDSLGRDKDDRIFKNWHEHKVGDALRQIVNIMGIDERRNIKFHSFKKSSVNYVLDVTGSIKQAQQHGNHKSSTTTLDSYIKKSKKLSEQPSYYMGKDIDMSPIHELSHAELLKIIESSSVSVKSELLRSVKR